MKNQWTNIFKGYVKVKISGKLIEQFMNRCMKEGIYIWQVKRHGEETVTCYVLLSEINKLRKYVRKYECKLRFVERLGFPFFIKRMLLNSGFLIGIIACLIVIFLLSNMVWNIEIKGANPKLKYEIQKELQDMGITKGKFQFVLPTVDDIQMELTERVDMITWVGVELKGTTYHLQVVEKSKPDEKEFVSPRHLVAKKKGVIYDYFVEEGQPLIEQNDFVNKGDILVSGIIGKEGKTEIVAATGRVFAEIWYKSHAIVPLKTTFDVLTGNYKKKHYLEIFGYSLPVWGFGKTEFEDLRVEQVEKHFRFFKWELPISYKTIKISEKEEVVREYDQKTAQKIAMDTARKKLKSKLPEDSTIKGEKILHQTYENGKVRLMIHFQVIEDIALEQPIIQGD